MFSMKRTALLAVAGSLCTAFAMANPDHHHAMMDANKDGRVSADEHTAGARSMFEKMDANKDGSVTAAEMHAAHKDVTGKHAKKSDMSAQDKIKVVDTDGDGRITAAEHASGSGSMFAKMDTDKDGYLSKQELAAGHGAMMKK